jgi:hypothetical protein
MGNCFSAGPVEATPDYDEAMHTLGDSGGETATGKSIKLAKTKGSKSGAAVGYNPVLSDPYNRTHLHLWISSYCSAHSEKELSERYA